MPTRLGARTGVGLAFLAIFAVAAPTVLAADAAVSIRDFAFSPGTVEIGVGDRVTWTNHDAVEHTATARNGSFDTGLIGEGESASVRFTRAGTYRFVCTPHPTMTGTVVVLAASGGVPAPNTDTAADPSAGMLEAWPLAALALVGLAGFVIAHRRFRRDETG